jgi:hypothetical protein
VVHYLSWMLSLALWWEILGKEGLILLSLGIGKEFLHIVSVSYYVMVIIV